MQLLQFSVVVVGQTHNPTILNPDFLASEGIVPKSWNWGKAVETMTTPPLSMVRYSNGVTIIVEHNKLQVEDPSVQKGPEKSKITEVASSYVRTLPHVQYTAVGTNFQGIIQLDSPSDRLINLFLKSGPWNNSSRKLDNLGLRLVYPVDSGKLTLSIDSGKVKRPNKTESQSAVFARANFNRNCPKHSAHEFVSRMLDNAKDDWDFYQQLVKDTLMEMI